VQLRQEQTTTTRKPSSRRPFSRNRVESRKHVTPDPSRRWRCGRRQHRCCFFV